DFGFDSLSLADFAARLTDHYHDDAFGATVSAQGEALPVDITPSLLFGYPTFDRLAAFILQEYGSAMAAFYRDPGALSPRESERGGEAGMGEGKTTVMEMSLAPSPPRPPAPSFSTGGEGQDEPIAVIGMSGRFPQARSVDEMWDILVNGRDAVTP